MTANGSQQTAKIYQFPVGGRAALGSRTQVKPTANLPYAPAGSGWYHDAAIEEDRHGGH